MHSDSAEAIRDIRSNKALVSIGEASTKAGVVLRLVSALGWNLFNVEEVRPEYTVGSRRLDYSLRIANMNKVFIEVERSGIFSITYFFHFLQPNRSRLISS